MGIIKLCDHDLCVKAFDLLTDFEARMNSLYLEEYESMSFDFDKVAYSNVLYSAINAIKGFVLFVDEEGSK